MENAQKAAPDLSAERTSTGTTFYKKERSNEAGAAYHCEKVYPSDNKSTSSHTHSLSLYQ